MEELVLPPSQASLLLSPVSATTPKSTTHALREASNLFYGNGVPRDTARALALYESLAERSHRAKHALANCLLSTEIGQPQDHPRAIELLKESARADRAYAKYTLGLCHYHGIGTVQNKSEAASLFEQSALKGYLSAQYALYTCYKDGVGKPKSISAALHWLMRAAQGGYSKARFDLGMICLHGKHGVREDPEQAFTLFEYAASASLDQAKFMVGRMCFSGKGTVRNYERAVRMFLSSVNLPSSKYYLYLCYWRGLGVAQNKEVALDYLLKSAVGGHVRAMHRMGECCRNGEGMAVDHKAARTWFAQSGQKQHYASYVSLGEMFFHGEGREKNEEKAVVLFHAAALHGGNPQAMYYTGLAFLQGWGERNIDRSLGLYWLKQASEAGHAEATRLLLRQK